MLFTPSDLLKVYLQGGDGEGVKLSVSDDHVKVYRTFRLVLCGTSGLSVSASTVFLRPRPGAGIDKRGSGGEQVALAKAFGKYLQLALHAGIS